MWKYEKKLQFPINVKKKDLKFAKLIVTQYGGADGELAAAVRYLNQRYYMPTDEGKALLTEIGTEEYNHIEMICTLLYQLTKGATIDEIKAAGLEQNYVENKGVIFPVNSNGVPFETYCIGSKGNDYIANLVEDMAAEQKARATYESLMDLCTDEEVLKVLSFLREREIVHFQRFGELLNHYIELKKEGKI